MKCDAMESKSNFNMVDRERVEKKVKVILAVNKDLEVVEKQLIALIILEQGKNAKATLTVVNIREKIAQRIRMAKMVSEEYKKVNVFVSLICDSNNKLKQIMRIQSKQLKSIIKIRLIPRRLIVI